MIFHVSIESQFPENVAKVIAEIWGGTAIPLDRLVEGSWIAFCGENPLSAVEVFPQGTDIVEAPGDNGYVGHDSKALRPTATHIALSTSLSKEAVYAIAEREGWRPKFVMRGTDFGVIEVWINQFLVIEWMTGEMQVPYERTVKDIVRERQSGLTDSRA